MARGDDWELVPLGEFVTLQRGHDLPDTQRRNGKVPILGSFGVTGWHDEAKAPGPGVTVGRSGASFGVVTYSDEAFWPLNTALYVKDFHGNDPRFAYYFLKSFDFSSFNSGSAQPSLNRNFVHPVLVRVPPLDEQRRIARILGTLDDKIELNRRMNETLEEMARALFKSWFVDFDPVRAKAEGRDPGLPKHLADLFPDRLVDSELGAVPQGWSVGTIGDFVELAYGKPLRAAERRAGDVVVVGANGPIGEHDVALVPGPGIVVGRKGTPGVVSWIDTAFFPIDTTFYVEMRSGNAVSAFVYHLLRFANLASLAADSAVPGLNRRTALARPALIPSVGATRAFDEIVGPWQMRQRLLSDGAITLARTRDTVLPAVIAGGALRLGGT